VSETEALFGVLRQSADGGCAAAIEGAVVNAPDHELCRVNALAFAAKNKLDEERTIAAFLHAARLGLFELSWNVLCPACGGVLDAGTTLKTVNHDEYGCTLCAADYKPTLDEMVEVTFTVSPRVRRIAGHDPDTLPEVEYYRQIFWSSGMDLPDDLAASLAEFTIDSIDVPPAAKAVLSVQLPEGFVIVFDPVTHGRQIIAVKGEPMRDRQALSIVFTKIRASLGRVELRPGPLRLSLENRTDRRVLPALWVSSDALHHLLGKRRPFLTAKRLLTNQTFRDLYNTDTLDPDQRLKITSLTFLFTDLKGSTGLYERVGDLVRLRPRAPAFRRIARDRGFRSGRGRQDDRRCRDGNISHAGPRSCGGAANAGGDDAHQCRARQRRSSPQDRHSRGTVSRRAPKQQPGLFRADREHRRPGAGPGLLARNLRDPAGGRRSKRSENPSKPEFAPVNAAHGTSRHRRRNDRVRDSVKA